MTATESQFDAESIKEIINSLYLIQGAHKQLEKEREHLTTAVTQISYIVDEFNKSSKDIKEKINSFDKILPESLLKVIQICGKDIAHEASQVFINSSSSQAEVSLKKMVQTTTHCENKIYQASEKIDFFSKWFMSVAVGGAIIGGLLVGGMFRYLPSPTLDKVTLRKIESGEILEAAWLKLDRKEKEKIYEITKSPRLKK